MLSLKVEPLGINGWESPKLEFGKRTTFIFARNGSGKTPIIQSFAACLGFPPKFRDEIYGKCAGILLEVEHEGETIVIRRFLGTNNRDFHIVLTYRGVETEHFNEGSFSMALFNTLGLEPPRLVSNVGQVTHPYISTLLPLFYLNQVDGYTAAYKSSSAFIEDQFVEMVRFVFGLNPKHSYDLKKELISEKEALEAQTRKIVAAQRIFEYQAQGIDDSKASQDALQRRVSDLNVQLESLRDSVDAKDSASSVITDLLRQKEQQIRTKKNELSALQNRISGIDAIRTEIEGEVKTLGLNEEARRVFSSFGEICSVTNCGLFVGSTESYGKNLLYLRDQIKDLDRNVLRAEMRIEQIQKILEDMYADHNLLLDELNSPAAAGIDKLVTAVQTLTKQLVETQTEIGQIVALQGERSKLFRLETERFRIQDRIDAISNSGRSDTEFNKLRFQLRELAVKWMDILDAQNVDRNIEIGLDLRFKFDGESLDLFSGSTKIRLVLAIHAAIFEAYISEPFRPFRFIILDTPKQQELHTEDLANYLYELEKLCEAKNAQLILSSTEYDHPTGDYDSRWLPMYRGSDHSMYLGKVSDFLGSNSTYKL